MVRRLAYLGYSYSQYFGTKLPSHWNEKRLSLLAKEDVNAFVDGPFGSDLKSNEYQDDGVPLIQLNNIRDGKHLLQNLKFISMVKREQLARHIAIEGDIAIAKMAEPVARAAMVSGVYPEYVIVADCVKLTADPFKVQLSYLVWAINSDLVRINAELVSTGTTRIRINLGDLKKLKIPYPPFEEQVAIANFLDHETAKIDTLIDKQQQLIKLLKEKRQAVISHAVTKGLNPDAPMKDSGVEWLREVPEHWDVSALGYFASLNTGATPDRSKPLYWNGDIPWVKTGEVRYDTIFDTEEMITNEGLNNSAVGISPPGTLLMAMYGQGVTRGRVALLGVSATYNQACVAISPNKRMTNQFLRYFFMAAYHAIRDGGNETSQMNLNADIVRKFKVVVPTISEQKQIIQKLDVELERYALLEKAAEKAVEFIKERRTALISAAVTGKIDVRNWQTEHVEYPMEASA